ncbi:MAG: hypothetical protein LBQ05_00595 [Christensenellaceae bacterium]|jgi:hypothetical protein|nr:hypothetical protein [Christensenellaceae bacterium]
MGTGKKTVSIDLTTYTGLVNFCAARGIKLFVIASKAIDEYIAKQKTAEAV